MIAHCYSSLREFIRAHLLQLILLIPGAILVTVIHESAHALAVVWQGGSVIEFVWLPSAQDWGHIKYVFPVSLKYSRTWISLAPYLFPLILLTLGVGLAWRRGIKTDRAAAFVYFWLYFVPVIDIGYTSLIWIMGGNNDFTTAFGRPNWWSYALVTAMGGAMSALGYFVQTRLYHRLKLTGLPYTVLATTTLFLLLALNCLPLPW